MTAKEALHMVQMYNTAGNEGRAPFPLYGFPAVMSAIEIALENQMYREEDMNAQFLEDYIGITD